MGVIAYIHSPRFRVGNLGSPYLEFCLTQAIMMLPNKSFMIALVQSLGWFGIYPLSMYIKCSHDKIEAKCRSTLIICFSGLEFFGCFGLLLFMVFCLLVAIRTIPKPQSVI